MLSLIKRSFYHILNNKNDKSKNVPFVIESFPKEGFIRLKSCYDNVSIQIPLGYQINSNFQDIQNELNMFSCIQKYDILTKKKYKKRRLLIYQGNPLHYSIIKFLIELNNYTEYHIFCNDSQSYNILQDVIKYNDDKIIRLNEPEVNTSSMFRIIRNEYEDYYHTDKTIDDNLVLLDSIELEPFYSSLYWLKNCYICMPFNSFSLKYMKYIFRNQLKIDVEENSHFYCIVKSCVRNVRLTTTEQFIDRLNNKIIEVKKKDSKYLKK